MPNNQAAEVVSNGKLTEWGPSAQKELAICCDKWGGRPVGPCS